MGIPSNYFGYQAAHSGNAYAGFVLFGAVREYIQAPLLSPLVAGESYRVSFYVSLAEGSFWAIDAIGAHFSNGPITSSGGMSAVAPPSRLVGTPNLAGGSATMTIGAGITEVTFTNRRPTGFLEICKKVIPGQLPGGTGSFTFSVNPGNLGPFVVRRGSCSPAIEVAAGMVTIKEVASPGTQMVGCSTIPTTKQVACNLAARISTVNVAPGDVSTQTIAIFTNRFVPIKNDDKRR